MLEPLQFLLIDDDPIDWDVVQDKLHSFIEAGQLNIVWANEWEKAKVILTKKNIQGVLLDYQLGLKNGLDLVPQIRNLRPDVAIVLHTTFDHHDIDIKAQKQGIDDFLVKGQTEGEDIYRSLLFAVEQAKLKKQVFKESNGPHQRLRFHRILEERLKNGDFYHPRDYAFMVIHLLRPKNSSWSDELHESLIDTVGDFIEEHLKPENIMGRISPSQFGILVHQGSSYNAVAKLASQIDQKLSKMMMFKKSGYTLQSGIVTDLSIYTSIDQLFKDAGQASHTLSTHKEVKHVVYHPGRSKQLNNSFALEQQFEESLKENHFEVYYQPVIDNSSGTPMGFEALIRWNHPTRGLISPSQFIGIAEETGFTIPLGKWVLETAVLQAMEWNSWGANLKKCAVNFSAKHFLDPGLIPEIQAFMKKYQVPKGLLEIEITETTAIQDEKKVIETIEEFQKLGISTALDDFGTGFSGFKTLSRIPVSAIKIDQVFVRNCTTDPSSKGIVETLLKLGQQFGMVIVAEGVEREEHFQFLKNSDCKQLQGYYFSAPLKKDKFHNYIREFNSKSS